MAKLAVLLDGLGGQGEQGSDHLDSSTHRQAVVHIASIIIEQYYRTLRFSFVKSKTLRTSAFWRGMLPRPDCGPECAHGPTYEPGRHTNRTPSAVRPASDPARGVVVLIRIMESKKRTTQLPHHVMGCRLASMLRHPGERDCHGTVEQWHAPGCITIVNHHV
jgi:hypothetical protein